jgi:DNA polymerase III delta prime subunit
MKHTLENELAFLADLLRQRLAQHFNTNQNKESKLRVLQKNPNSFLAQFKNQFQLSDDEYIVFLTALVPHIQPNFFSEIIQEFLPGGGEFTEFGGVKGSNHRGVLPTGETLQFILGGNDLEKRLEVQEIFSEQSTFYKQSILYLEVLREGEPVMSGRVIIAQEWIDKILFGKDYEPRFGMDFPARKISTEMHWSDLVLHPRTSKQIQHISTWLEYHHHILEDENLKRKIKPGYRVLLYGPPGTGKTLTATLLGKQFKKDVYRVDLSQIVSKFIGETEKNLENVFRRAESRNWILFFDEADALFGKRTSVQSSHDKYANQEVSYLLQRVEDYSGLLILSSNFKNNLDDAFIRRFHEVVHFPLPDAQERKLLWEKSMPSNLNLHESVNLSSIANTYEMTGASILSVVQYASLRSYEQKIRVLQNDDIIEGIRREFMKEEKSV